MRKGLERIYEEVRNKPPIQLTNVIANSGERDFLREKLQGYSRGGIRTLIKHCKRCTIARERPYDPVPFVGEDDSRYLFYGRMPGKADARENSQFFSKSPTGQWFEKYLQILGLHRDEVFVTSAVFCPTKDERSPEDHEVAACSQWKALEFYHLKKPKFIFLMGNDAVRSFINPNHPTLTQNYGQSYWTHLRFYPNRKIYVFPILHPGSCLREPDYGPHVMKHLLDLRDKYLHPFLHFLAAVSNPEEEARW